MEEDEYLEDDIPTVLSTSVPEHEPPEIVEKEPESHVTEPALETNGNTDSEASTPVPSKRSCRQKPTRARKCVVKPNIIGAPTSTTSMDNVYLEPVASGWARCFPRFREISKERAFSPINSHILAKVQASTMKMIDVLAKQKEKRSSKMRPVFDEKATVASTSKSSERSMSPEKKRKSLSRGVSEIRGVSIDAPSKRSISREKSQTPVVVKEKMREETKEERKERKRKSKEAKEFRREERRLAEERAAKGAEENKLEEKKKRKEEKERAKREKEKVTSVDITGWDADKIAAHFGLQKVVLQITSLTQATIDAALAYKADRKRSPERSKRSSPVKRARIQSESPSPVPTPRKDRALLVSSPEPDETDKRTSPPPPRSPSPTNNENDNDVRKKSKAALRKCVNCQRELHMCVDQWYSQLGTESQYCSTDCIEEFVERVREKNCYDSSMKVPMLGTNNVIRRDVDAPTLEQLAQYIRQSSSFIPLCMSDKAEELEKKEREAKAKIVQKASKFMSKESDILRQNLRVKIGNELFQSGRLIEKKGMNECRSRASEIEKELFRLCKDCNHPKYKFFSDKLKLFFIQYRNFASKVNEGMISVAKLCSIDPEELNDFCRNNNVTLYDNEDNGSLVPSKVIKLPTVSAETLAATQEISKHIPAAPPVKMGRIPKKPKQAVSALDALLGDGKVDTTSQHNSHYYDANCSICAGKAKAKADRDKKEMEDREKFREEERIRKEKLLNYNDRKESKRGELKRFDVRESRRTRRKSKSPLNPKDPLKLNQSPGYDDEDYAGGRDDGSSSPPVWSAPPPEVSKRRSRQDKSSDESWRTWVDDNEVWRGNLHMGTVTFVTSLRAISNKAAFDMRDNADLSANLHVKGRIKELIVFEYLGGLRKSEKWDVITLQVEKPLDMEQERKFNMLYQDMVTKDRYQALNFENHPRIKEAYLLPIRPNEEAPAVLLPWKGPGLPEVHAEIILFVAVRSRHGAIGVPEEKEAETSKTESEVQEPPTSVPATESHKAISGLSEETKTVLASRTAEAEPSGGDLLIPPIFFDLLKNKAPPTPKNPEEFASNTLPDVLQYINDTDNPKLLSKLIHELLQDPSLSESEKNIIKTAVQNKIAEKKRKREMEKAGQAAVQPAPSSVKTVANADEYAPDQPNEPGDEEAQDNDSTAGNEADANSRPMSASDFDMDHPTSFVGMGDVLAQLAPPPLPPVPPVFNSSPPSESSNSNFALVPPPPQPPSSFLPLPPQAPPLATSFSSLIPQIPLPMAKNARSELMNIPPPTFDRTGGIPVIGFGPQDQSETNSVEATVGEDSPPDEEDLVPRGIPTIGATQFGVPPPVLGQSLQPPPMAIPVFSMMPRAAVPPVPFQPGMPPPNMNIPPPMFHNPPPKPFELHGSAGFRGLAPSLGGTGISQNSSIDFFNMATSTSTFKPKELGSGVAVPVVALPPGTALIRKNAGTAPGLGRAKPEEDDDNIPRTPTPPLSAPRPGIRPGVRPGVRPGAGVGKRVAPGARLPVRPTPTPQELEIMEREERRRKRALEREEENNIKRVQTEEQGRLRNASEANSTEESSDIEDDLAASRGLKTVRMKQKKTTTGIYAKVQGYAYEHSTGSVTVTKQRRALNVDYDEDGNEIVPDDAPSSDEEDQQATPVREKSPEIPVPKKTMPLVSKPTPQAPVPMDRNKIPPLCPQNNAPKPPPPPFAAHETSSDMDVATDEHPNEATDDFDRTPWKQQHNAALPPQQFFNRGPRNNWPPANERPSQPNEYNNQYDPHYEDGYGYPPRGPPPPNFSHRGRGQPQPFRGRGQPPMHGHPPRGPPPSFNPPPIGTPSFRGRGIAGPSTPQRHGGPPPLHPPPNTTRGHPYYNRGGHQQPPGSWNGPSPSRGAPRGHPPGRGNFSPYPRGGPPPKAPPLAAPPFNGPPKPNLLSPPPPPPLPPSKW